MAAEATHGAAAEGRRASLYSEQREYDAKAQHEERSTASSRFVRRLQDVPYACGYASNMLSFIHDVKGYGTSFVRKKLFDGV